MQDIIEAAQYLQGVNIIKLQSAARLAGLRWKSGAPGYDKAGIIEKLQNSPSIMRATVSALRRMEGGNPAPAPSGPNPFAEALEDDAEFSPSPSPAPSLPAPSSPIPGVSVDPQVFHGLTTRIQALEDKAPKWATHSQADEMARNHTRAMRDALMPHIEGLTNRVKELETRKPVELVISPVKKVSIPPGAHKSYPKLLEYLEINGRVILTGSAGTGKSMAVKNAANDLGLKFYVQTPVTMSHEYLGHRDAQGVFHETPTFQAYTKGGVLLWDEADAGLPDAMLAANPIFDGNGFAVFGDGNMYEQHPDFRAVFNMNTDGNGANMQYAGRNRLDGATLARFGVRIHWDIDPTIEASMALGQVAWHRACVAIRDLMASRQIQDVNATPRHVKTGAALLTRGTQPRAVILRDVMGSGALLEVWKEVENLPAVRAFLQGA